MGSLSWAPVHSWAFIHGALVPTMSCGECMEGLITQDLAAAEMDDTACHRAHHESPPVKASATMSSTQCRHHPGTKQQLVRSTSGTTDSSADPKTETVMPLRELRKPLTHSKNANSSRMLMPTGTWKAATTSESPYVSACHSWCYNVWLQPVLQPATTQQCGSPMVEPVAIC